MILYKRIVHIFLKSKGVREVLNIAKYELQKYNTLPFFVFGLGNIKNMDYSKCPLMVLIRLFPLHIPSSFSLTSACEGTPCPCYRRNKGSKTRFWRAEKAACLMNPSQSIMLGHRFLDCSPTCHWMILTYYKHFPLLQESWGLGHPMWWMRSNQRWNRKVPRDFTVRRGNGHPYHHLQINYKVSDVYMKSTLV